MTCHWIETPGLPCASINLPRSTLMTSILPASVPARSMRRVWPLMLGALALALPAGHSSARTLDVALCGGIGGADSITIPLEDAPMPDDHRCCHASACHSATERKEQRRNSNAR